MSKEAEWLDFWSEAAAVRCPYCNAQVGEVCRVLATLALSPQPHSDRLRLARG